MIKEEAITLAKTKFWEKMSYEERAEWQLSNDLLCMPFGVFHEAIEKTLNRPVDIHEFAFNDLLIKEFLGRASETNTE